MRDPKPRPRLFSELLHTPADGGEPSTPADEETRLWTQGRRDLGSLCAVKWRMDDKGAGEVSDLGRRRWDLSAPAFFSAASVALPINPPSTNLHWWVLYASF